MSEIVTRDWIESERVLQIMLGKATSFVERESLKVAARSVGGPDPDVPGGGEEWVRAVQAAREDLVAAEPASDPGPVREDAAEALLRERVQAALLRHPGDLDRSVAEVLAVVEAARGEDRLEVAGWLERRSMLLDDEYGPQAQGAVAALRSAGGMIEDHTGLVVWPGEDD